MKGKCENCGKKLSVEETENEKCLYCSQRRASIGVMVFGVLLSIFFFLYGIIRGFVSVDEYDYFNTELMFYSWGIGFACLLGYWLIYTLFTKLDIIIGYLKEK